MTGEGVSNGIVMVAKNGAVSVIDDETGWLDVITTASHIPHFNSSRTLGYWIHVVWQSLVPEVPLCIYQPSKNSKQPSGLTLHGPEMSSSNPSNNFATPGKTLADT